MNPEMSPSTEARLVGMHCTSCGAMAYPFQAVCPICMAEDAVAETDMPTTGTVYAFSTVHAAPKKWRLPYTVGYVDLPNGVRVFSHLDPEGLSVGAAVYASTGIVSGEAAEEPRSQLVFKAVREAK